MNSKQRYYRIFNEYLDEINHLVSVIRKAESRYVEGDLPDDSLYNEHCEYLLDELDISVDHLDEVRVTV